MLRAARVTSPAPASFMASITQITVLGGERYRVEGKAKDVERLILDAARGSIMQFAWLTRRSDRRLGGHQSGVCRDAPVSRHLAARSSERPKAQAPEASQTAYCWRSTAGSVGWPSNLCRESRARGPRRQSPGCRAHAARMRTTGGRVRAPRSCHRSVLEHLDVCRCWALLTLLGVVAHFRALGERLEAVALRSRVVYRDRSLPESSGVIESKALVVVEPFHGSCSHLRCLLGMCAAKR